MGLRVVLRGGGDLASGVAHRLRSSGFEVFILEIPEPTVIRRWVAFANAIYEGETEVEGIKAKLAGDPGNAVKLAGSGYIPVLIDPECSCLAEIKPTAVVDCILAKKNLGTTMDMASVVVGAGPGFYAGRDVHAVVETKRGHNLGRVIYEGEAYPNTGVPGNIGGFTTERLLKACCGGTVEQVRDIGTVVCRGDIICRIEGQPVKASIDGVVRGLINNGAKVDEGMKIGDIDPRGVKEYCYTISDKARAVAGGMLEAILHLSGQRSTI